MPVIRRLFPILLALLGLALAQPQYGGTLRVGLNYDPISLDPHRQPVRQITELVYDTLVRIDAEGNVVPGLAHAWSVSEDGLRWTFHLHDDVTFHNGEPLLASDVVFSIERILDPATASPRIDDFAVVESVAAVDDLTVVFTLAQPYSPLASKLGFSVHAILSEDVVAESNPALVAIGTGPFRLVDYVPQVGLAFERFDDYWEADADGNPLPYLDTIDVTIFGEITVRTAALLAGELDFINQVPAADVGLVRDAPELRLVGGPSDNIRTLLLNNDLPPFDDRRVRQAVAHAIDEQAIVDLALFGEAIVARGTILPAFTPYGIDTNPYLGKNTERARELLAEAGYADGFELAIYTTTLPVARGPAEVIQSDLIEAGIDATIVVEEFGLWIARTLNRDFGALITGTPNQPDPDDGLYISYHSEGGFSTGATVYPELDRLLELGRQVSDVEERKRIYAEAQEIILEEAFVVFLFHSTEYEGVSEAVRGYEHYLNSSHLGMRSIWIDR